MMGFQRSSQVLVPPHGGRLIQRELTGEEKQAGLSKAAELQKIVVSDWAASDVELISTGAYSPLTGFMNQRDYESFGFPSLSDRRSLEYSCQLAHFGARCKNAFPGS